MGVWYRLYIVLENFLISVYAYSLNILVGYCTYKYFYKMLEKQVSNVFFSRALFRKNTGKKPTFTITLPKKSKDDPEDW
jgi:hypothetical protein